MFTKAKRFKAIASGNFLVANFSSLSLFFVQNFSFSRRSSKLNDSVPLGDFLSKQTNLHPPKRISKLFPSKVVQKRKIRVRCNFVSVWFFFGLKFFCRKDRTAGIISSPACERRRRRRRDEPSQDEFVQVVPCLLLLLRGPVEADCLGGWGRGADFLCSDSAVEVEPHTGGLLQAAGGIPAEETHLQPAEWYDNFFRSLDLCKSCDGGGPLVRRLSSEPRGSVFNSCTLHISITITGLVRWQHAKKKMED